MKPNRGFDSGLGDNDPARVCRVEIDPRLCIGAGNCSGIAPDLFYLDDDGKATVTPGDFHDDASRIIDAAWSCPTDAISVFGPDGERIYPPPDRRSYLTL